MILHSTEFVVTSDPLFWYSCFVRLFPRGDCLEKCFERSVHLPSWRWAKCLLTRSDTALWRTDVEFVASLYNIFLRRDQVSAVEATVKRLDFNEGTRKALHSLTAAGLMATALASGDVNSVRAVLKKNLEEPIGKALREMNIAQSKVRGSEAERDNFMPKFVPMRLWNGCASPFLYS